MVETSVTLYAAISTIIVVTMATIFLCCWRKKESRDIGDGKLSKKQNVKPEESGEKSGTQVPACSKSENGVVSDSLSSPTFVVSNEELGDFSAVQRETEILRSYRKPPPPKNRARQSRAPRAFKSSTENLDIFTELNEEDRRLSETNVKSDDTDEVDSSLLRPRSQVKEGTREARSSMLADIEQTLAALHMSDDKAMEDSKEGSPVKDIVSSKESEKVEDILNAPEKKVTKSDETEMDKSKGPAEKSEPVKEVKTDTLAVDSEYKAEAHSPQSSPKLKHKQGPQVSPKPNMKLMGKKLLGEPKAEPAGDNDTSALKQAGDSSLSSAKSENISSYITAASSFPVVSESANEIAKSGVELLSQSSMSDTTSGFTKELSSQDNLEEKPEKPSRIEEIKDQLSSQVSSIPSIVLNEKNGNATDSSTVKAVTTSLLQSATNGNHKLSEHVKSVADVIKEDNKIESEESRDSEPTPEETVEKESPKSVSKLITTNGHDAKDTKSEKVLPVREVSPPGKPKNINSQISETSSKEDGRKSPPLASPERDIEASHRGTSPDEGQDGIGLEKTEGHEKQRHGSAEDSQGKGKGSRIPVRAGSKPRSSPPKVVEKTAEAK